MSAHGNLTQEALWQAIAISRRKGFEVIQSDAFTLLCDLDTAEAEAQFQRVIPLVKEYFSVTDVQFWPSKSGKKHAMVRLSDPLSFVERLALQAALGSDGVREALSLVCAQQFSVIEPSLLFKPAQEGL